MIGQISDSKNFNQELKILQGVFEEFLIDSCSKNVAYNILTESTVKLTVEMRLLILSLPFLGYISLQLKTKLRKSFKNILDCFKIEIVLRSQRILSSQFRLKEPLPYGLMSKVV